MTDNMETFSNPTVRIDRRHFEVLVRRANPEFINNLPALESLVCIPEAEYDSLVQSRRQYETLKHNLMASGMDRENLTALCEDNITTTKAQGSEATISTPTPSQPTSTPKHEVNDATIQRVAYKITPQRKETVRGAKLNQTPFQSRPSSPQHVQLPPPTQRAVGSPHIGIAASGKSGFEPRPEQMRTMCGGPGPHPAESSPPVAHPLQSRANSCQKRGFALKCQRSVSLTDLPPGATWWDVTSAVRGGALVDVYLQTRTLFANVSFLTEESARAFFEHASKNGIYVKDKKVSVDWAQRQFWLSGYDAAKAAEGTTRNLVIRNCGQKLTEAMVRADLGHIHGLVVIKVDFDGADCHIKTNSLHYALYARTSFLSRRRYKGMRIEWDADECDQPVEA
ncbi:hypothetical protein F5Y05DRAFT_407905 [Hypoxylon sp. FL0543]|nr:hypothetical protein F5Y05DRAFT_407905 [Hypoxylon sp. FL0543]